MVVRPIALRDHARVPDLIALRSGSLPREVTCAKAF